MSQYGYSIAHLGLIYNQATGDTAPSTHTVYEMTLRGEIPASFINGRWYVSEADKPRALEAIKRRRRHTSRTAV